MNHIGLHIIGDAFDPQRLCSPGGAVPKIVKLVDPSDTFKRRVRQAVGRDCLIVIRYGADQPQPYNAPGTNAQEWYSRWIARMIAQNDPNVAFEGYNEAANTYDEGELARHVEFDAVRLALMQRAGLRCVVGNYGVGHPPQDLPKPLKMLLAAMKAGDLWGHHSYWTDRADIDNPWHTNRWTLTQELYALAKAGRLVVTECGRDYCQDTGQGKPGWKLTCGADEYLGDLVHFAHVIGGVRATVFTAGIETGWAAFGVNDIWQRVVSQYAAPVPPPPPAVNWEERARRAEAKLAVIKNILEQ